MSIAVRPYAADDAPVLRALMAACQDHYDLPPLRPEAEARMLAAAASGACARVLLAWADAEAVGFAVLIDVWPSGDGTALYLKELFVAAEARGTGAGRALMAAAAREAQDRGARRLQWETSQPRAAVFYDALGADRTGYVGYAVEGARLAALAAG